MSQAMNSDLFAMGGQQLRGLDSNTLLRLFDQATMVFKGSLLQQERARADRTIQRITRELERRKGLQ